ncbi:MAG: glycosyltransferase, partial [bacterium]|nr:glycosyltransferase [bacterium]MDW8164776.1 glycosyltransferase family 2 protein [Candidatus Omnitrophota bacterium]
TIYLLYSHFFLKTYTFFYLFSTIYFIICIHKLFLVFRGLIKSKEIKVNEIEIISNRDWPLYTILLPIYKEKEIFNQLYMAMENIDYPKDKLDIILLIEEDDLEIKEYLKDYKLPFYWRIIEVPNFKPKTKGKALNFGLNEAKGEFLVIYDAEDIPEKDQLKKAVLGFRKVSKNVVCLQSKLNYYNPNQNILTKWFTAEYSSWFDLYLPGIDSLEAPIPLGGTSNHFKTDVLKKLKGWDPFNVTEDCDLGIRIFMNRYRTKVLDTTTWEEANSELSNWIKQRSRWVKGYIQTYFVHMRNPFKLIKKIGLKNFFHFNLIVGGNFFVLCFNPIAWIFLFIWLFSPNKIYFPNIYFLIVTPVLLLGNIIFVIINVLGVVKRKWYRLIIPTLIIPLYWVLMSIGALKGLFQFFRKPHYWEKTQHALFIQEIKELQT